MVFLIALAAALWMMSSLSRAQRYASLSVAAFRSAAAAKLAEMSDEGFEAVTFAPADEYEPDGAA
jgi:hypothetical protein